MESVSLCTGNSSCNRMNQTDLNELRNIDDKLVSNFWCHTDIKVINISFTWTINKYFSFCEKETGQVIESSTFKSRLDEDVLEWRLQAYPKGNDNLNDEYLAIYLKLLSSKLVLTVSTKCSILNIKWNKSNKKYCEDIYKEGDSFGFREFIERDVLFSKAKTLVPGDKLTILCEMCVVENYVNTSGNTEIVRFEMPVCRLIQDLGAIMTEKKYTDVILVVGDKEIHAHKAILSARSPFFAMMFLYDLEEKNLNRVEITDMDADVLVEMLSYMYSGVTTKLQEMAEKLLPVTIKYGLNRLNVLCQESLYNSLSVENAVDTLKLAEMHSAQQLRTQTINFINTRCDPRVCAELGSRCESLSMMEEEEIDNYADSWCNTDVKVTKINFTWTIKNFSLCMKDPGDAIGSSTFSSHDEDGLQWFIDAYLRGESNAANEYFGLFLCLKSEKPKQKVWARYSLSFLNSKQEKVDTILEFDLHGFDKKNESLGTGKAIKRSILLKHITDDRLIILCELSIFKEYVNTSGTTIFKIPKCKLRENFKDIYIFEIFSDVTFVVENKELNAHKAILSARSPVFAKLFEEKVTENANNRIEITYFEFEVFNAMLRYIYTGEIPELKEMGERMLIITNKYGLKRLNVLCQESLYNNLSVERVPFVLILSNIHSAPQLKTQILKYINNNNILKDIIGTIGWKVMMSLCPHLIEEILKSNKKLS